MSRVVYRPEVRAEPTPSQSPHAAWGVRTFQVDHEFAPVTVVLVHDRIHSCVLVLDGLWEEVVVGSGVPPLTLPPSATLRHPCKTPPRPHCPRKSRRQANVPKQTPQRAFSPEHGLVLTYALTLATVMVPTSNAVGRVSSRYAVSSAPWRDTTPPVSILIRPARSVRRVAETLVAVGLLRWVVSGWFASPSTGGQC